MAPQTSFTGWLLWICPSFTISAQGASPSATLGRHNVSKLCLLTLTNLHTCAGLSHVFDRCGSVGPGPSPQTGNSPHIRSQLGYPGGSLECYCIACGKHAMCNRHQLWSTVSLLLAMVCQLLMRPCDGVLLNNPKADLYTLVTTATVMCCTPSVIEAFSSRFGASRACQASYPPLCGFLQSLFPFSSNTCRSCG